MSIQLQNDNHLSPRYKKGAVVAVTYGNLDGAPLVKSAIVLSSHLGTIDGGKKQIMYITRSDSGKRDFLPESSLDPIKYNEIKIVMQNSEFLRGREYDRDNGVYLISLTDDDYKPPYQIGEWVQNYEGKFGQIIGCRDGDDGEYYFKVQYSDGSEVEEHETKLIPDSDKKSKNNKKK